MLPELHYRRDRIFYLISSRAPCMLLILAILLASHLIIYGRCHAPLVFLNVYNNDQHGDYPSFIVNLLGWLSALTAIAFAASGVQRNLLFKALSKILDEEWKPEQSDAKTLVSKAKPGESSNNPYSHVRQYEKELCLQDRIKLDKARRRLTGFYYRVALFYELHYFADPDQIFRMIGDPEIIETLERLEAIKAESIDPKWKPRPWPPMKLLILWYSKKGCHELNKLKSNVPAQPKLYDESRKQH